MGRLEGKVALISGAARGQGEAEARLFANEGAKVVFGDILDMEGEKVEAEINETGGEANYIHLDVTNESEWETAVKESVNSYGKLDILVNNAGIYSKVPIEEASDEEFDLIMSVNLKGVFLGTKYVWGGKHFSGVDCSGLIQLFFNFNNKYCPRDTKDQISYFKKKIKLKNIRKNDLIFWKGHVAIAISNKSLIHAYGPLKSTVRMPVSYTHLTLPTILLV